DTMPRADAADAPATSPVTAAFVRPESPTRQRRARWIVTTAVALVIVAAVAITAIALSQTGQSKRRPRASQPIAGTAPASTVAPSPASTAAPSLASTAATSPLTPITSNDIASEMARTVEVDDSTTHFMPLSDPVTVSDGAGGTLTAVIGERTPTA